MLLQLVASCCSCRCLVPASVSNATFAKAVKTLLIYLANEAGGIRGSLPCYSALNLRNQHVTLPLACPSCRHSFTSTSTLLDWFGCRVVAGLDGPERKWQIWIYQGTSSACAHWLRSILRHGAIGGAEACLQRHSQARDQSAVPAGEEAGEGI